METIFDYNITPEELEYIRGSQSKEEYMQYLDDFTANYDLAALFYKRRNQKKATYYANKLPVNDKNDFWRTVTHS